MPLCGPPISGPQWTVRDGRLMRWRPLDGLGWCPEADDPADGRLAAPWKGGGPPPSEGDGKPATGLAEHEAGQAHAQRR